MENEELLEDVVLSPEQDQEEDQEENQEENLEEVLDQGELDDTSSIINNLSLSNSSDYDFTTLEALIQDNNETLHSINENMFRLYYFVGGLYVVFMIIIVIKFFKQFF